jgi:cytochrome P450
MVKAYLKQHLGSENMAAANGAVWKKARTIYNPAFATPHLMTVIPNIVTDVLVFHEVLSELAESQEVFQMESTAMKLSFDVIGRLVLNLDLNSQRTSDELVDAFRKQLHFLSSANTWSSPLAGFNPIQQWKIRANSKVIHRYLGRVLDNRFSQIDEDNDDKDGRGCCIMDKALYTYNTEIKGRQKGSKRSMDVSFRKLAIDQ